MRKSDRRLCTLLCGECQVYDYNVPFFFEWIIQFERTSDRTKRPVPI